MSFSSCAAFQVTAKKMTSRNSTSTSGASCMGTGSIECCLRKFMAYIAVSGVPAWRVATARAARLYCTASKAIK